MLKHLTNADEALRAYKRISDHVRVHKEWLCSRDNESASQILQRDDFEFQIAYQRLIFSYRSEAGALTLWRVVAWQSQGAKILLKATTRAGMERTIFELTPRASAKAAAMLITEMRRNRCMQLAELACALTKHAKVKRASLSAGARRAEPGRYARIILDLAHGARIAVTGAVTVNAFDADRFLSSALIWFARCCENVRAPRTLWLIIAPQHVESVQRKLALLKDNLRRAIRLYEIDEDWCRLTLVPVSEIAALWNEKPKLIHHMHGGTMSETATRIVARAPQAIDVVRARHGETLRYHGLGFARVRRVMNCERIWFGIEGPRRRLLDEDTFDEYKRLLEELALHRQAKATDHRHALYKLAPEAWLESQLRRDITQLDPGLRLAPLHAQFRTAHEKNAGARPIDLLALRRDGRLVIIELKIAEDVTLPLQGADYWRRISAQHRAGHIKRTRLFDDAKISDELPLIYLVGPLLRFHRAFNALARSLSPEIEMYRFDINEDWRAGVRVVRRVRVN